MNDIEEMNAKIEYFQKQRRYEEAEYLKHSLGIKLLDDNSVMLLGIQCGMNLFCYTNNMVVWAWTAYNVINACLFYKYFHARLLNSGIVTKSIMEIIKNRKNINFIFGGGLILVMTFWYIIQYLIFEGCLFGVVGIGLMIDKAVVRTVRRILSVIKRVWHFEIIKRQ